MWGIFGAIVALLVVPLACMAVVLSVLTTYIHRSAELAASSAADVRTAHDLELEVLIGPLARRPGEVMRRLAAARARAGEGERALIDRIERTTSAYFATEPHAHASSENTPERVAVLDALDAWVDFKEVHARAALADAAHWDALGDELAAAGLAVAVLSSFLIGLGMLRLFVRPLEELDGAMRRFRSGDHGIRASPAGAVQIAEIGRTFNELAEALSRTERDRTAFVGSVAHDLRDPLTVISFCVEKLGSRLPPAGEEAGAVSLLRRQLARLERLVADFLDLTRIEAGKLGLVLEPNDLQVIVASTVEMFRAFAPGRSIEADTGDAAIAVVCDRLRIEQALGNLLSNAIKYSPPETAVRVRVDVAGEMARVEVTDRGPGILQEDLSRIFEPFQRRGMEASPIPGTGLGLFAARRIVEAHGGRIEVESVRGEGSTFRLTLPRAHAQTREVVEPDDASTGSVPPTTTRGVTASRHTPP